MDEKKKETRQGVGLTEFLRTLPQFKLPWGWILLAFALNVAVNQLLLEMPGTTASLLSGNLTGEALWGATRYYLIYAVTAALNSAVLGVIGCYSVYRGKKSVWRKMLRICVPYYDKKESSQLMSAVTNDTSDAVDRLVNLIVYMLPELSYIIQALMRISKYHYSLVLAEMAILPLKYIRMVLLGRYINRFTAKLFERIGALTGYLAERVHNLPLIKQTRSEKREEKAGASIVRQLYRENMNLAKVDCASSASQTVISIIEKIVVMMAAVLLLQRGIITMEQWVAFFLFSTSLSSSFDTVISVWVRLKQIQGSASRAVELMHAPEEDLESGGEGQPADASVEFSHVSFSYGEGQALTDISFTVPSGKSLCIVGQCGSGKTTVLSLMERFYEPAEGEIRLGGVLSSAMPLPQYRKRLSYVQQSAGTFGGTVREAMTYGLSEPVSDERLMAAARSAGLEPYIKSHPMGLDAPVASGGDSLSGGQRQRLVLAREFLRNADVVLLDEPTSALDAETTQLIRGTIREMFGGKTVVIVSHDLDLARDMDAIAVLEGGRCVAVGTADELKESCGAFRRLEDAFEAGKEAAMA